MVWNIHTHIHTYTFKTILPSRNFLSLEKSVVVSCRINQECGGVLTLLCMCVCVCRLRIRCLPSLHRMGCRCFWDQNTDNYAEETFTNVRNPTSIHIVLHRDILSLSLSLEHVMMRTQCDLRLTFCLLCPCCPRLTSAFLFITYV